MDEFFENVLIPELFKTALLVEVFFGKGFLDV